jgi:hypothetical protein
MEKNFLRLPSPSGLGPEAFIIQLYLDSVPPLMPYSRADEPRKFSL